MARSYRHIKQYEEEIIELREIGERFGLTYDQVHDFFKRRNRKQRKTDAGIVLKKKGSPPKMISLQKLIRSMN